MTKEVVRANDLGRPFLPVRFNISHAEFQMQQPEWNIAIGAAASIPVPVTGVSEIMPRIVRGLEALRGAAPVMTSSTAAAKARFSGTVAQGTRAQDLMTWRLQPVRAWIKRYRVLLAGSAALVLAALLFTQSREPEPPPLSEIDATGAASPDPTAAPGATSTTVTAATDKPLETAVSPERRSDPVTVGRPASTPSASLPARGTPAVGASAPRGTGQTSMPTVINVPATVPASPQPGPDQPVAAPGRGSGFAERPAGSPVTRDPTPAAAPNTPALTPVTITAAALVKRTIADYERAAEALDVDGVRRVWPDAPDGLRNSYRNLVSQTVDLDCAEPAVSGDTATVSCREQIRSVGAGRITLPLTTNTATFSLRRNGDTWEISRISR